jgi:hypothetical protein
MAKAAKAREALRANARNGFGRFIGGVLVSTRSSASGGRCDGPQGLLSGQRLRRLGIGCGDEAWWIQGGVWAESGRARSSRRAISLSDDQIDELAQFGLGDAAGEKLDGTAADRRADSLLCARNRVAIPTSAWSIRATPAAAHALRLGRRRGQRTEPLITRVQLHDALHGGGAARGVDQLGATG